MATVGVRAVVPALELGLPVDDLVRRVLQRAAPVRSIRGLGAATGPVYPPLRGREVEEHPLEW